MYVLCTSSSFPNYNKNVQKSLFNFPIFIGTTRSRKRGAATKKKSDTSIKLKGKAIKPKPASETQESYKCPSLGCERAYKNKKSLIRHMQYECQVPPKFKCQFCSHRTWIHCNMLKHIKRCHSGKKANN